MAVDSLSPDATHRSLARDPQLLSLTLISVVGTFGAGVISPALPSIAAALGVANTQIGLLMTAFTLPQIFLVLLLGMLADTFGRRVVLLPSLVAFGLAGVAVMVVDTFTAVLGLRLLQGVVAGAIIPLAITLIGDIYEGAVGATAQGIRLSANGLSSVVVPATAGFLAGLSWQYPFALFALAFPAAALGYVYLPEVGGTRRAPSMGAELREYGRALRTEASDPSVAVLILGGFVQGLALYGLVTYVPLFAVSGLGATAFAAGLVLSTRGVARIAIAPLTGLVLERVSRRTALAGSLAVSAVGVGAAAVAPSIPFLAGAVALFGLGDAVFTPVHRDGLTALSAPDRRAGVVNGMVVARQVGATIAPPAFGVVLALAGFGWVFATAGVVFGAFAVVVAVVFDPRA